MVIFFSFFFFFFFILFFYDTKPFSSYITDMEGMGETSECDYMDEMLEYDAERENDCDISSEIADPEESLTDEDDHIATDSNTYEAALGRLSRINLEYRPQDIGDEQIISDFLENGCGCSKWNGNDCIQQFFVGHIKEVRMHCQELSHGELDLLILGQLLPFTNNSDTVSIESRHSTTARVRQYCSYHHQGKPVCLRTFLFLHSIGSKRLKNLLTSFQKKGTLPRVHGNFKRLPSNALSFSSVEHVVSFVVNYAEENSILLPGRIPGYKSSDLNLLPSSKSKKEIWRMYEAATGAGGDFHAVAYRTFCRLWKTLLPDIVQMRPMSDLCWQCKQNSNLIMRSANLSDTQKHKTLESAMEHLQVVTGERSLYRSVADDCSSSLRLQFSSLDIFQPPSLSSSNPENSKSIKAHYSFDYAQMVRKTNNLLFVQSNIH